MKPTILLRSGIMFAFAALSVLACSQAAKADCGKNALLNEMAPVATQLESAPLTRDNLIDPGTVGIGTGPLARKIQTLPLALPCGDDPNDLRVAIPRMVQLWRLAITFRAGVAVRDLTKSGDSPYNAACAEAFTKRLRGQLAFQWFQNTYVSEYVAPRSALLTLERLPMFLRVSGMLHDEAHALGIQLPPPGQTTQSQALLSLMNTGNAANEHLPPGVTCVSTYIP
jgi:hypothetical protein